MKTIALLCAIALTLFSCGQAVQEHYTIRSENIQKLEEKVQVPPPEPKPGVEESVNNLVYERSATPTVEDRNIHRGGRISLHFEDISLQELLNEVFYKILGLSYMAPTELNQRVTVHVDKISKEEAYEYMKSLLETAGYGVVMEGKVLRIVPQKANISQGLSFLVYKPTYIAPQTLSEAIKGLLSPIGKSFLSGQAIVVIDEAGRIGRIRNLVQGIDTALYSSTNIAFIRTNLPPEQVKESLEKILRLLGKADAPQVVEALKKEGLLVVVSSDKNLFEEIKAWIRIIEEYSRRERQEVAIYRLNFVEARTVAEIISSLGLLQTPLTITTERVIEQAKPQMQTQPERAEAPAEASTQKPSQGQQPVAQGQTTQPAQKTTEATSIREERKEERMVAFGNIIADPKSNSLIVKATPLQHQVIKALIAELDRVPKQVLIEMVVAEVSLGDSLQLGFEGLIKGFIDSKMFNISTSFGLIPNAQNLQGANVAIFNKAGDLRAILNFLSTKTSVRVLSAPHIIVRDNEEATIQVGAEVPVLSQQLAVSTGGLPSVQNQVQYRNTGIILRVVPTISTDNRVTLKIYQEVSDAVSNTITPQLQSPIITKRSSSTTLIIDGNQVALLGGIIQSKTTKDISGVPLLSEIPGLGILFRSQKESTSNTELIVLIKASVINTPEENTAYKGEFLEKTRKLRELIREE